VCRFVLAERRLFSVIGLAKKGFGRPAQMAGRRIPSFKSLKKDVRYAPLQSARPFSLIKLIYVNDVRISVTHDISLRGASTTSIL
jgi:hypothetical protein